ncbi:hypothetical protein OSB04_006343 [Centaurea solstitialis]|uniref:DNA helicase Pif1-like 2B domain-containing protein n=1 Tax=Centaurea solstitialis TaxID=347529 RepID=A0AA38TQB5_9ASTR|nr:hypothetical protein OSB04_006343 [Centaurea solstitialis]
MFRVYELNQNKRLHYDGVSAIEALKIETFDKWMLQVGDKFAYVNPNEEFLLLPQYIHQQSYEDPMDSIIKPVYPNLLQHCGSLLYLMELAILTPKNYKVKELKQTCHGYSSGLRFCGIPNHDIHLKLGTPVMLLRNLNQTEGLCNGRRMIITLHEKWSVRGDIVSRSNFVLSKTEIFTHGQLYVVVSRVTSCLRLMILNDDEDMEDQKYIKNIIYHEVVGSSSVWIKMRMMFLIVQNLPPMDLTGHVPKNQNHNFEMRIEIKFGFTLCWKLEDVEGIYILKMIICQIPKSMEFEFLPYAEGF